MAYWNEVDEELEGLTYEETRTDYSKRQLEALADEMLKEYGKRELCRECLADSIEEEGQETGSVEPIPQFKEGDPVVDEEGHHLILDFPELTCSQGHKWFLSEGKSRGNQGTHPILFEEHLIQRRRREIYTNEGTPDPNIVSGIYNRSHPQGRKINTDAQRKLHGASYYR